VAALTEQAAHHADARDDEDAPRSAGNNAPARASRLPRPAPTTPGHRAARRRPAVSRRATVVPGQRQDDELVQTRCSGPVITVQRFTDEDEAVRWANGVRYGPGVQRVDQGLRPGHADEQAARLRLRVDQHPHPAGRRDAPRRVQALRLRQGPVGVRLEDYTRIKHVMANIDS
jgi:betaine-aldehyde dehydrogenase